MTNVPTGTVTFLFTDIEGSTKIAREQRAAWPNLQKRHHAILRAGIEANNGYVFQIIGDAFCASFHTVTEAVEAALACQRALQAEDWGQTAIRVRMGINSGTAQAELNADGSTIYSGYATLVRTQRVMSIAYGGQVLLSNAAADLVADELPTGVSLLDMQEHRLKGLLNPEHLWQLEAPGLTREFPALQSLNSIPTNLPIQLTSFIGREKELGEIKSLLDHNRLVTLTGSGGVGKTRHSLQVAAEVLDAFSDGIWLVELAAVSDAAVVPQELARVLGVREDQSKPLVTALREHLEKRTLLVVLDNCEHLLGACAELVDTLLRACPHLKVLASSREALGVPGEAAYRVPSLALPDRDHLPPPEDLQRCDSVRLFMDRAVAVKSDFALRAENAAAVAQICSRLDGIPLAIELAAARVTGLPAEEIARRLDDRFRLLTAGRRTGLPRHQTLLAMIGWSYDLLSEAERLLLRRLSVFVGDWALEAAESVCADPAVPAADVLDLTLRLVDKSLIVPEERAGHARYRLLETIGEFARQKLSESGEEAQVRLRHLEYFLEFSEQAAAKLRGDDALVWLNGLGAEYENLHAALAWARGATGPHPGARLAAAMEQLGDVRGLMGLWLRALAHYQEGLELWRTESGPHRMPEVQLHGKIVLTVADMKFRVDSTQYEKLLPLAAASNASLVTALEAVRSEPPSLEQARLLTALSTHAALTSAPADWDLAERYARAAVDMAEELDAPVQLSVALGALHDTYYVRGFWRECLEVSQRRLRISREPGFGDMRERVLVLMTAAQAMKPVGEYTEALSHLAEAESLAAEMQAVDLEKWALQQKIVALFQLDRWYEILGLEAKRREMQRRYPQERIGVPCFEIALIATIHARRGELELAVSGRAEANAIMTANAGPFENWNEDQHH